MSQPSDEPTTHISSDEINPSDIFSFTNALNKLADIITTAIKDAKSVTAANKRRICVAAEDVRIIANTMLCVGFVPHDGAGSAPTPNVDTSKLKDEIMSCVREEMGKHLTAVESLKQDLLQQQKHQAKVTYATVASAAASAAASASGRIAATPTTAKTSNHPAPPTTRPAIIVTPKENVKTKEESVAAFKKSISFRDTTYAPAKVQTLSNNKLRVEFDSAEQRDDALNRLRAAERVSAEPARRLMPMIILKGVSGDVPAEELVTIIRGQNPDIGSLIQSDADLCFRFKRNNRNEKLYNAVLVASPNVWRRIVEVGRVCVDYQRVHAEDFSPFLQCFRCLQFGHTKAKCTNTSAPCAHCADIKHTADSCPIREKKGKPTCYNCVSHNTRFNSKTDTGHKATSPTCPRLRSMRERIGQRVDYGQ